MKRLILQIGQTPACKSSLKRETFSGSSSWMSLLNLLARGEKFIQVVTGTNSTVLLFLRELCFI